MFTPTRIGPETASLSITDAALGSSQSVALSGTGVFPVSLSSTSLSFGNQLDGTNSVVQMVTLTSISTQPVSIAIAVTGTNASDFPQTNTCGSTLAAGASCTISVTFTPTQIGPESASVTITDVAVGSSRSVALSGTGLTSGPNVTLSPTRLDRFPGTVTLANYGAATLAIASITITGKDPADFSQTNTCGSSVAPGASCTVTVTVTFSPPAAQGASKTQPDACGYAQATLSISDNGVGSPQTVFLMACIPPRPRGLW